MTIKQDFKELLIYTVVMLTAIILFGTYEPAYRTFCLVLAGVVILMFTYMGKKFITIEQLVQTALGLHMVEQDATKSKLGENDDME